MYLYGPFIREPLIECNLKLFVAEKYYLGPKHNGTEGVYKVLATSTEQ